MSLLYKKLNERLGTDFRSNSDINWYELVLNRKLSWDFIREHKRDIGWGWNGISSFYILNEDLIREFKEYVNWNQIVASQLLSWDFMMEFKDKLNWNLVSLRQPFIDPEYFEIQYRSKNLTKNKLYQVYQQTKERGWFFGYIDDNDSHIIVDGIIYTCFYYYSTRINKSRIYWKDLVSLNYIEGKNYELIRQVKHV